MKIGMKSVLSDIELTSVSFGELDLIANTIDSMFESLRRYQEENKVKITNIYVTMEDVELGREIKIRGMGEK